MVKLTNPSINKNLRVLAKKFIDHIENPTYKHQAIKRLLKKHSPIHISEVILTNMHAFCYSPEIEDKDDLGNGLFYLSSIADAFLKIHLKFSVQETSKEGFTKLNTGRLYTDDIVESVCCPEDIYKKFKLIDTITIRLHEQIDRKYFNVLTDLRRFYLDLYIKETKEYNEKFAMKPSA